MELIVSGWHCLQLLDTVDLTFTDLPCAWKAEKSQAFSIPNPFPSLK